MSLSTKARRAAARAPLEAEVRLGDWAAKGGVSAEVGGRNITVDRGIPGELAQVTVDRRRRPWRGVVDVALEPSDQRVEAPCPAYHAGCGGCQWQHLDYAAQVATRRALVDRAMAQAGLSLRCSAVHVMDDPWRYRHTAAIALGWEAGFRPRGRRGIVEVHDCLISHPLIGALSAELNRLLRAERLPRYHGRVWLDCTVVGTDAQPALQVVLQGIEGLTLETHPELPEVAATLAACPSVCSVSYRHRSGTVYSLCGEAESTLEVAGRAMWVAAGAFVQANISMLNRLIERVRPLIRERSPGHLADVYGGTGTFALALADELERVTLIELDASAVAAARRTAEDRELDNISFVARHAELALPALADVDLIVVDPPRSGLGTVVTDAVAASSATSMIYVSCAPESLARDLAALGGSGFQPAMLELFDFYPQTYHAECLTVLDRVP